MKIWSIEWYKLRHHRFFWIGMGLFVLLLSAILFRIGSFGFESQNTSEGQPAGPNLPQNLAEAGFYQLPQLWHHATYIAGFFKFIPAFLLLFFLTSEYQYRSMRQNIIDGLSRAQFFWSKVYSALFFTLISCLVLFFSVLILAFIHNDSLVHLWTRFDYFVAYFWELFSLLTLSLWLGLLLKRSAIAVIVLLLYYFFAEPLLRFAIGPEWGLYLPMQAARSMIQEPFSKLFAVDQLFGLERPAAVSMVKLGLSMAYSLGFLALSYRYLQKRDL